MEYLIDDNFVTIKLEDGVFVAYLPDGQKLPHCLEISLSDNFNQRKQPITATIKCLVNIQ
jgi:hypothetical protein